MKILVVDDHAIVRQGVHRLLSAIAGAELHEVATAREALSAFRSIRPDVVVLDINLGGSSGLELLQRLMLENPSTRVVMFSMHSDPLYAARAISAGALGFVSKSAAVDELATAVMRAAAGERYVDREVTTDLAAHMFGPDDPLEDLTNREIEILRLLGEGKSLAVIGQVLGIAYKTVANTCSRLKVKLGVERTADLIRLGIERERR